MIRLLFMLVVLLGACSSVDSEVGKEPISSETAYAILAQAAGSAEPEILRRLHRDERLIREDISIKPTSKAVKNDSSGRWSMSVAYGFVGYAEISVNEIGEDARVDVCYTGQGKKWSETFTPEMQHSQIYEEGDGGMRPGWVLSHKSDKDMKYAEQLMLSGISEDQLAERLNTFPMIRVGPGYVIYWLKDGTLTVPLAENTSGDVVKWEIRPYKDVQPKPGEE